jgi:2-phosphoglycerate kinase
VGNAHHSFSTGEVVEALQAAGVPTDEAIRLARETEKHFSSKEKKTVELAALVDFLADAIQKRFGSELAARFLQQRLPFVPLTVSVEGGRHEPFSRTTLAASLEKHGLSFKEANAVARAVAQGLRTKGQQDVSTHELTHTVAQELEVNFGREVRHKYEAALTQPTEIVVVDAGGLAAPFSRGVLARSLMTIGLGLEFSYSLSKSLEDTLWRSGQLHVDHLQLRHEVARLLRADVGEDFARRYELLRSARHPEHPLIILLGGAPGVGKSTVATELAYRLGIQRIVSSDAIRQALRSLISPELSPVLHSSSYAAWLAELLPGERQLAKPRRKRVIRGFQAQVQQLGTALTAIISRSIREATSLVMEGVHLVPGIVPGVDFEGATVFEAVLVVTDEAEHKKHFLLREGQTKYRRRDVYLEHFGEIRTLQSFINARAEQEGVPVVESADVDRAVDRVVDHVWNMLLIEQSRRDEVPNHIVAD